MKKAKPPEAEKITPEKRRQLIREKGIRYALGYGIFMKNTIFTPKLSHGCRTLYLLFCSLADENNTCYPKKSWISKCMGINMDTLDTWLKELVAAGIVSKSISHQLEFLNQNIYTVLDGAPRKRIQDLEEGSVPAADPVVGFGFIPRAVMMSEDLDAGSKLIYGAFAGFAGAGYTAFPKRKDLLYLIGMSEKTFYSYRKPLILDNYLTVSSTGNFAAVDLYTLNKYPDTQKGALEWQQVSLRKKAAPGKISKGKNRTNSRNTSILISDVPLPGEPMPNVPLPDEPNAGYSINNSVDTTSVTSTSPDSTSANTSVELINLISSETDRKETKKVNRNEQGIHPARRQERVLLAEIIKEMTDWQYMQEPAALDECTEDERRDYNKLCSIILDACSANGTMKILKNVVTGLEFKDRLNACYEEMGRDKTKMRLVMMSAVKAFEEAIKADRVGQPISYLRSTFWQKLNDAAFVDAIQEFSSRAKPIALNGVVGTSRKNQNFEGVVYDDDFLKTFEIDPEEYLKKLQAAESKR